jgi:hypothetical protein
MRTRQPRKNSIPDYIFQKRDVCGGETWQRRMHRQTAAKAGQNTIQ